MDTLTAEQLMNWRRALYSMVGPYALIATVESILTLRDVFLAGLEQDTVCNCDPKRMGYTRHTDDTVTCNHCHRRREESE